MTMVGRPSTSIIQRQPGRCRGLGWDSSHPDSGPPITTEIGMASMVVVIAAAR